MSGKIFAGVDLIMGKDSDSSSRVCCGVLSVGQK